MELNFFFFIWYIFFLDCYGIFIIDLLGIMNVSKEKEEEDEMGLDLMKFEFVGFIFFVIVNVVCNVLVCIVICWSCCV